MGLMQTLRSQNQLILWILLILFVLSMTIGGLVGGANILDIISGKAKLKNLAGMVNDEELKAQDFVKMLQSEINRLREQGQEVDEPTTDRLSDQIWSSFVTEVLLREQVKKYGLEATDREIYMTLVENPPEFLRNQEAFMTDGKFDYNKYLNALNNPQGNEWLGVEQYLRYTLPLNKVNTLVRNLASVSESEIRDHYIKTKIKFDIETLLIPYTLVSSDTLIKVSDEEIKQFYEKNKENFFVPETRRLKYVFFPIKPTRQDTLNALETIKMIQDRLKKGETFETLAAEFSEDEYSAKNGGDLGWFGKGHMVKPFEEAAFSGKKGEIVGPVLTKFGYHLIKVEDKRRKNGKPQVKAKHILIKIKAGPETIENLRAEANLFAYDAGEYGFEAAADTYKVTIKETEPLGENTKFVRGLGFMPYAVKFAFSNKPVGSISEVYRTDTGYVIFQLAEVIKEHYRSIDEVKDYIANRIETKKRHEKLKAIADSIFIETEKTKLLKKAATDFPKLIFNTHRGILLNNTIKGIGKSNELIGAVLSLKEGEITQPIKVGNRYVIVKLVKREELDEDTYKAEKEAIRDFLLQRKRDNFYNNWLAELKSKAKIIDNRNQILY